MPDGNREPFTQNAVETQKGPHPVSVPKAGVYLLNERSGDGKSPVVYFNGKEWWLPGWECGMTIGGYNGSFTIHPDSIGELIWEDENPQPR